MQTTPAPSPASSKVRWAPMWVLAGVNLVDQVDTSILRGVLPLLEDDWGLSDFQLGLLGFSFIIVHTFASIPAGWVADRYKRTRIIGFTLLSWSALSALAAVAINYWNLFAARAALGLGQAIDDPSSTSLLADYYAPERRGRVYSVQQVMTTVGGAIGLGIGGLVGNAFGWRWAFLVVGAPGSLIALLVFRLREPKRGESDPGSTGGVEVKAREEQLSFGQVLKLAARDLNSEIRMIFGIPTMRYILVGVGTLLFTVSGVGFWLTVYHERYSGMSAGQAAVVTAAVLGTGGLIGTLSGGFIADRVYGTSPARRITVVGVGIMACTALFLVSYNVPNIPARLVIQAVGVTFITSAFPGLRASMMDVVPAESRGVSVSAFALTSAVFGNALAPPLVGFLSDLTSLLGAYYIVTPPVFVGTFILLRARKTLEKDAARIFEAMVARAQAAQADEQAHTPPAVPADTAPAVTADPSPTAPGDPSSTIDKD